MELQNINSEKKYSSLYLVEQVNLFRVQEGDRAELLHYDFLKKIRKEFDEEIVDGSISVNNYKDSIGRNLPMYELDYEQSIQILSSESRTVRKAIRILLKKQQAEIERLKTPQTFIEAMELVIVKEKERLFLLDENNKKDETIKILLPKADFYDAVTDSTDTIDIGTVAKVLNLGYGRTTLFQKLRDLKVLLPNNIPNQIYINKNWFRVIEEIWNKPDGSQHVYFKTVVFQKGIDGIRKMVA